MRRNPFPAEWAACATVPNLTRYRLITPCMSPPSWSVRATRLGGVASPAPRGRGVTALLPSDPTHAWTDRIRHTSGAHLVQVGRSGLTDRVPSGERCTTG